MCLHKVSFLFPLLSPYLSTTLTILGHSYCSTLPHAYCSIPGLALGGVWGVREGARRPLAVSNTRLRINSILNSVTRRGTFIGNSAGVLGMSPAFPALSTLSYCLTDRNQLQHLYTTGLIRRSTPCADRSTRSRRASTRRGRSAVS